MNVALKQVVWESGAQDIDVVGFEAALDAYNGVGVAVSVPANDVDNADLAGGVEYAPRSIREAEKGCAFLQHVRHDAVDLPEPEWKHAAVLAANAAQPEGREWFHEVSKPDSRYSPAEADRKFDETRTPPTGCDVIARDYRGCSTCPHLGRIANPLLLAETAEQAPAVGGEAPEIRFNQHGEAVALVKVRGYRGYVPLGSQAAQDALMVGLVGKKGKGKPPSRIDIDYYSALARQRASEMPHVDLHPRVVRSGTGFAIDMADGNYISISKRGVAVEPNDGMPFSYVRGAGRLPAPYLAWRDAGAAAQFLEKWIHGLGVDQKVARLLLAALVLTLTPHNGVTFLVLQLIGSAGSGKTTAAQMIISLIAPVDGGEIPDARPDYDSLLASAQTQPIVFMDNVTGLDGETQDILCKCATGTAISKRRLYSDNDAVISPLHATVMLTGVSDVITRHDLRDRALTIPIRSRRAYVTKEDVRESFNRDHPRLLGALCYLAHIALRDRALVKAQRAWSHRLTDWLITGEAISQAVGDQPDEFVGLVEEVQRQAAASRLEDDGWLSALTAVLRGVEAKAEARDDLPSFRELKGQGYKAIRQKSGEYVAVFRPETLLKEVRDAATDRIRRAPQAITNMPDSARALNKAIEQAIPTLKRIGLTDATKRAVNGPSTTAWYFMWSALEVTGGGE
jgi:hypothetical protein